MISWHTVRPKQGKVLNIGRSLYLLAVNGISKSHRLPTLARNAKTQRKGFSSSRAPVTLRPRDFARPGVEKPSPLRPRFFRVRRMSRGEISIRQPLLEDRPRHLAVQLDTLGLLVFLVPTQPQPFQSLKNRIHRGLRVAFDVSVVKPQDHSSAVVPGIEPVENKSAGAAHMEKSGGRGRKAHPRLDCCRRKRFRHKKVKL